MHDVDGQSGWVGWTGDSWGDLPPETRERVRHTMIERHRARGPLAAIVHVRVYADGAEPHVSFTEECTLGPDADKEEIAAVVERARVALDGWR
jgi:hypothetical protein